MSHMHASFRCKHTSISTHVQIWQFLFDYTAIYITVRRKIFATEKFRESLQKRGGRNIRDKNIREGGSDTLRNTITWLLRLCGSSDL